MARRSVLVAGWIGSTNLGDELILQSLRQKLTRLDASAIAISTDPEATSAVHQIESVGHHDVAGLFRAAGSASAMVFGGGGLLQDETSRFNLPYHLSRIGLARTRKLPVAMFGMGAGPLRTRTGKAMVRSALRSAVLGSVRDVDSADVLESVGLARPIVAADPVLSLSAPLVEVVDRVAVCLRPWHGGGLPPVDQTWRKGLENEWFPAAMASALDDVASRTGLGIHMVAFQAGRDSEMQQLVADRMTHTPTTASPNLDNVLAEVGSCRAVVSLRYHGAIVGTLSNRPSVLIGYSDKVLSLANELGDASRGVAWTPDGVATIPASVESILGKEEVVAESLARLRARESGNDEVLERLLAFSEQQR